MFALEQQLVGNADAFAHEFSQAMASQDFTAIRRLLDRMLATALPAVHSRAADVLLLVVKAMLMLGHQEAAVLTHSAPLR